MPCGAMVVLHATGRKIRGFTDASRDAALAKPALGGQSHMRFLG